MRLQRLVRETDNLGRFGGGEFKLIVPHTRLSEAEAVIDQKLVAVRRSRPLPQEVSFRYSFRQDLPAHAPDEVYRPAGWAVYAAKRRGRDQIAIDLAPSPRLTPDPLLTNADPSGTTSSPPGWGHATLLPKGRARNRAPAIKKRIGDTPKTLAAAPAPLGVTTTVARAGGAMRCLLDKMFLKVLVAAIACLST